MTFLSFFLTKFGLEKAFFYASRLVKVPGGPAMLDAASANVACPRPAIPLRMPGPF